MDSLVKRLVHSPGVALQFVPNLTDNQLDKFVLNERKNEIKNIVSNYYMGFSINISNITNLITNSTSSEIRVSAFYSRLAYHSCAVVIDLVDNILLAYLNSFNTNMSITTYNKPMASNTTSFRGNSYLKYLACFDILPLSLLNILTAINIAFFISLLVMHASKERIDGFKTLQILSGTHTVLYWISNYIFDLLLSFINVGSLVGMLALVGYYQHDQSSELYAISSYPTIGYVALLLFISSFTWPIFAHIWSFIFKSDVTGFVILVLILGVAPFIDVVLSFILLFLNTNQDDTSQVAPGTSTLNALRYLLFILFPNVTVKKGIYNLKLRSSPFCVNSTNSILKGKSKSIFKGFIEIYLFEIFFRKSSDR